MWNLIGQFTIFPDFSIIKCITDIDGSSKSRKSHNTKHNFPVPHYTFPPPLPQTSDIITQHQPCLTTGVWGN